MSCPEPLAREILQDVVERDFAELDAAWERLPESSLPAGLTERTLARLRAEGLLEARVVRVDWRRRLAGLSGVAAALLLVAALHLWPGGGSGPLVAGSPAPIQDWAAGLELPELFESPRHELQVRLERVSQLLPAAEESEVVDGADELRTRLDRLSEELEAF
ncbi:MAG: hypothetical protein WC326_14155 [Candidatus Delongbacteria bacterium]